VAGRTTTDVGFGHLLHLDRREHARLHVAALERVLQRERVEDGRQHPHVVGRRPIHSAAGAGDAAKDVAAADDDGDLSSEGVKIGDFSGDVVEDVGLDAELLPAEQGFAAELEQDTAEAQR